MENINWKEIQIYYNDGNNVDKVLNKFKIGKNKFYKFVKLGFVKLRSKSDALKLSYSETIPRKHTDETKRKISEIRIKYLLENPDKVPYKLNHSSKESYPEKYFTELFEKENVIVEKSFRIGLYELDFCIPDKRIDIEIDGGQHYYDSKIVKSDIKRTKFLEDNGWDVIRINWSDYKSMRDDEKHEYVFRLKEYLNGLISEKPTILLLNSKGRYDVCRCGCKKMKQSKNCKKCVNIKVNTVRIRKKSKCLFCGNNCTFGKSRCSGCYKKQRIRKVERPEYEQLLKEIEDSNYSAVGRKYGVSDASIRKWIKYYEKLINGSVA